MLWKRTPTERISRRLGRITALKMPPLYKKAVNTIKPETINFCWRKLRLDVGHDFTGLRTINQGNHGRDWPKKWEVKGFKVWILENFKSWQHTTRINRWPGGDECFWTSARWWERRCRSIGARKQTDSRQSGRGFWLFKTASVFFYDMDPSKMWHWN